MLFDIKSILLLADVQLNERVAPFFYFQTTTTIIKHVAFTKVFKGDETMYSGYKRTLQTRVNN